ncbi:MAG: hypothetical protein Q9213_000765 [Squamulea squamosa]
MIHPFGNATGNITSTWIPEPNGRGTFNLLSSCIVTISLCVYSAIHLNLPQHGRIWSQFQRKLMWLVIGLIAPELVAYIAWQQRYEANLLLKGMQTGLWQDPLGRRQTSINGKCKSITAKLQRLVAAFTKPAKVVSPISPPSINGPNSYSSWTLVHGFYALMGGFAFSTEKLDQNILPSPHTRATLTPAGVIFLLSQEPNILPYLSPEQIKDKSKADGLKKTLVCAQATWFCVQCIARTSESLPLSLLELNTVAHALCTLVIYILWWHKPLDVEEPTLITDPKFSPILAYMWMSSRVAAHAYSGYDIGGRLRDEFDCIWPFENPRIGDLVFETRTHEASNPASVSDAQLHPKPVSLIAHHQEPSGSVFRQDITNTTRLSFPMRQPVEGKDPALRHASTTVKPSNVSTLTHREASQPIYGRYDYAFRRRERCFQLAISQIPMKLMNWSIDRCSLFKNQRLPPRQPPGLFTRNNAIDHLTPRDVLRWKLAHEAIAKYNLESDLRQRHATPVNGVHLSSRLALRSREVTFRIESIHLAISVSISGLLYGGLHLVAWNAVFASDVELLFWRISAIFVASNGLVIGLIWIILLSETARSMSLGMLLGNPRPTQLPQHYDTDGKTGYHRSNYVKRTVRHPLAWVLFCGAMLLPLLGFSYVIARVYLVVAAFRNLAYLPASAFETPNWPTYFPHIT